MSLSGVNASTQSYATTYANNAKTENKVTEDKKNTAAAPGAVYTPSGSDKKATYSINKMSSEKRAELVKQMKADQETRQNHLVDIVNKMLTGQAKKFTQADDDFWKVFSKGGLTVSEAAKKDAQQAISEDGEYGVKKTAQRIFEFASALAGDDVDKMKKMQAAFEKGYKQAEKAWGGELPSISGDTHKAVTQMFEDYYSSKGVITDEN